MKRFDFLQIILTTVKKKAQMSDSLNGNIEDEDAAPNTSLLTEEQMQSEAVLNERKHRSFFERTFAPLQAGALRGSIFALLASSMGTGLFNLPYRLNQIGLIPYVLFIVVAGFFSYVGMYMLSRLIYRFEVKSYSDMCERAFGSKFKKFAEMCIVLYAWGITVCYQVIIAKFILQLLADTFGFQYYEPNGGRQKQIYTDEGELVYVFTIIANILLCLIFILKKDINVLHKISVIGVLAIIFSIFVIALTMITGFQVPDCKDLECDYHGITHLDWDKVVLFGKGGLEGASYQFQGIASLIFCYVNHQLLFPLIHDLKNPTKKRMDKIFFRVHFTEIVSYMLVGLAGYLLLVEHADKRDINAIVIASIVTTTMSIGKVLLVLSIFFSIPLNTYPTREVLFESFQLERNNKNHILLSLGISFSGTIIGIFFQNVSSYFGILGGTAGVMMAGGFPALCYYKLKGLRTNNQKMLIVFTVIVSVCAAIGAILSVFDPS